MATCKQCREFEKCKDDAFINGAKFDPNESVKYCTGFEPITNSDRIRAMNDEELASNLYETGWDCQLCSEHKRLDNEPLLRMEKCDENCVEHCLEWLKQPAEDR